MLSKKKKKKSKKIFFSKKTKKNYRFVTATVPAVVKK
jgi:hypothetical protein